MTQQLKASTLEGALYTAFPISGADKERIERACGQIWGVNVLLTPIADSALIAGIRVEAGGRTLESSLMARLLGFEAALTKRGKL